MAVESDARVLIVDDERDMCSFLSEALRRSSLESDCAYDGMQALRKLSEERFDLVLVDVRMPGMSGLDLLQQIRQHHPHVVVIVMTAYSFLNYAIDAVRYGAYDYLVKPFEQTSVVIDAVRRGLADRVGVIEA